MGLSINGFNAILIVPLLLLVVNVSAETTFVDNPDNALIMGNFSTTGHRTGEGGCTYNWDCTNWDACLPSGKQTRNCTNIGTCSNAYNPPEIEQNCNYTPSPENGDCGYVSNHTWVDYECCDDAACGSGKVCENHTCVPQPECTSNSECSASQRCANGICKEIPCTSGYYENHTCAYYAYCDDISSCASGEACVDHKCIALPITGQNASDAINDAQAAVDQARSSGKNVTQAEQTLQQAQQAYDSGNYAEAKRLADQAAQQASQAQAGGSGTTPTIPGSNTTGGQGPTPSQEPDWLCLGAIALLAVLIIAALLLGGGKLLLGRRKGL